MKRLFYIAVIICLVACQRDDDALVINMKPATHFSHKIPVAWNLLYLNLERYTAGYRPPVAARSCAYVNLTAYEAIVHGSLDRYKSLTNYYPDLIIDPPVSHKELNWEVVLNAAYERAIYHFFPTAPAEQQFDILELAHLLNHDLSYKTTPEVYNNSVEYGHYVADQVYKWSEVDSWGHQGYMHNNDPAYIPPTGDEKWKPTYPDFLPALLPHWGKVRTFSPVENFTVPPPPAFSTDPNSELYKDAYFVQHKVNEVRQGLNEEEHWIAEFWSDDCPILTFTPSGRWINIASQLISIEKLDMMDAVALYAKVSMALSDAGIRCWGEKYRYNLLRPIDYIRLYMDDPQWNTVMCPDGSGGFYTPPFPTYPSGHATFGGAATTVLESVFGSNYAFTDRSHEGRSEFRSKPRSFKNFREMADENGYSRVPLGVHFTFDSQAGVNLGRSIGREIVQLPWQ